MIRVELTSTEKKAALWLLVIIAWLMLFFAIYVADSQPLLELDSAVCFDDPDSLYSTGGAE